MSTALFEGKLSLPGGLNLSYVQTGSGDRPVLLMPGALGTGKTDFMPQLQGKERPFIPAFLNPNCSATRFFTTTYKFWVAEQKQPHSVLN